MKPLLLLCFTLLLSPVWAQPEKKSPVSPWRWGINLQAGHNYPSLRGWVEPYGREPFGGGYHPRFEASLALGAEAFLERRLASRWFLRTGLAAQYLLMRGSAGSFRYNSYMVGVKKEWITLAVPLEVHHLIPVGQRGYRLRLSTGISGVWYPGGLRYHGGGYNEDNETSLRFIYRRERAINLGMQAGLAWEVSLGNHFLSFGAKADLARFRPFRHEVRVMEAILQPPPGPGFILYNTGETLQRIDWQVAPTTLSFELGFLF